LLLAAINLVIAFNMGTSLPNILNSPIGQPMATILTNSFGKSGTIVVWSFIIIAQFMMGNSYLTAASRQVWAFSRDGALPLSKYLYRINSFTGTPVTAVWFVATCAFLLALLSFAGAAAIGAAFTLCVVCQYIAFTVPIAARFLGGKPFKPGPFHLGALSLPIAVIAILWMTLMEIILLFPSDPSPIATNMNYTVVVIGGTLFLAVGYYFFPKYGGKIWFRGPIANIGEEMAVDYGQDEVKHS